MILVILIQTQASVCAFENIFGSNVVIFQLSLAASGIGVWHGISRAILHGPTKIKLEGICRTAFFYPVVYIAVGCAIVTKVVNLVWIFLVLIGELQFGHFEVVLNSAPAVIVAVSIIFTVNMVLAIFGLMNGVGCNRKLFSIIITYPMFLLLPVFSPFVVSTASWKCACWKPQGIFFSLITIEV